MRWFRRHRLSASEAFELELAGVQTGQSVADLLPVTDLLRATARGRPQPTALRGRRGELVALARAASPDGQGTGRHGRAIRATVMAVAVAAMATAGGFAATLAGSLLHSAPAPISRPAQLPPGDRDQTPGPTGSARASPGMPPSAPPRVPQGLTAELRSKLTEACGQQAVLPDLSGLNAAAARARVDGLIAACGATPGTTPGTTLGTTPPSVIPEVSPELAAELLAKLKEACGQEAELPDLSGLDAAAARARVDVLIAACDLLPATLP